MLFCIRLPNLVQIEEHIAKIWRHIHFSRWRPQPLNFKWIIKKYYFRFRICWWHCLQNVKVYQETKFRWHISIYGWDIYLLPVLKNKRPPYWNSTSGFDLDHFAVICMFFCIRLPNFVQIGIFAAEIWCDIDFQDGGRQPCCICFGVTADHPRSAFHGLNSVLKSLVRRINSSGDIATFGVLAWNCLFTPLLGKFLGNIFPI